jgi:hypothetical protein
MLARAAWAEDAFAWARATFGWSSSSVACRSLTVLCAWKNAAPDATITAPAAVAA